MMNRLFTLRIYNRCNFIIYQKYTPPNYKTCIENINIRHLHTANNLFRSSELNVTNSSTEKPEINPETLKKVSQEINDKKKAEFSAEQLLESNLKEKHHDKEVKDESNISKPAEIAVVSKKWPDGIISKFKYAGHQFVAELKHYYYGFKLFFIEIKICFKLFRKFLSGDKLTRRERVQLVKTTADTFRIIPFIVFLIIPLMEFLIPFYIKFFPSMMPSTFRSKSDDQKEKDKRTFLKSRIEFAKLLQDTLEDLKSGNDGKESINLDTFQLFMKNVRETGYSVDTRDIMKFSRLFKDEITLESLNHSQIKALCRILGINSMGPKVLLLFHLRIKVFKLKTDDKLIDQEGLDSLTDYELISLCHERGMRAMGVSKERLKHQLAQWINLSLHEKVPISLLLLSRAMYLPETLPAEEQLKKAILVLPSSVSKKAILEIKSEDGEDEYEQIKTKIELFEEEREAMKQEKQEFIVESMKEQEQKIKEVLVDKAPIIKLEKEPTKIKKEKEEPSISSRDISQIENAIEMLDKDETGFEEDIHKLKAYATKQKAPIIVKPKVQKLEARIEKMIKQIDSTLSEVKQKAVKMEQSDNISKEKMIEINDLIGCLKQIRSKSQDVIKSSDHEQLDADLNKWIKLLEVLDEDHDGKIEIHHISELMDILDGDGDMNMKMSVKEIEALLESIDKEDKMTAKKGENKTIE